MVIEKLQTERSKKTFDESCERPYLYRKLCQNLELCPFSMRKISESSLERIFPSSIVDSTRVDGRYSTRITFYRSRLSRRNSDDRIYSAVLKTLATYKSDKTVIWNLAIGICTGFWQTALRCLCDDHPPSANFKKSNVIQIHWIVLYRVSSF